MEHYPWNLDSTSRQKFKAEAEVGHVIADVVSFKTA